MISEDNLTVMAIQEVTTPDFERRARICQLKYGPAKDRLLERCKRLTEAEVEFWKELIQAQSVQDDREMAFWESLAKSEYEQQAKAQDGATT